MTAIPKYSWLKYQKNSKKVTAIMNKLRARQWEITSIINRIKRNNLPLTDDFVSALLNEYLLIQFKWGLFCACYRNIEGLHPLVSEEIIKNYTFDSWLNKSEGVYYANEFKKIHKV